jgi:methyl-accepting chemotaxis protein
MNSLNGLMRQFTIRTRMLGAIGMVLALFALVGAAAFGSGTLLKGLVDDFVHHSLHEVRTVSDVRIELGQIRLHEKNMVIDYEDGVAVLKHQERWKAQLTRTREALNQLLEGEEDEDNPLARQALKEIDQYQTATLRVLEQVQNGAFDNARAADRMLGRAKEHVETVHQLTNQIETIVDAEAAATQAEFHAEMTRTVWWFAGVLGLVVLIVVPLTLVNSSSITRPVLGARDLAVAIAEGQLDHRIDTRGQDETAELMRALARMQQTLGQLVGGVRQASESIQVASSEVASGNTDLSQRMEQTASNLEQTASSME